MYVLDASLSASCVRTPGRDSEKPNDRQRLWRHRRSLSNCPSWARIRTPRSPTCSRGRTRVSRPHRGRGAEDDRAFATRLVRCCARSPVALERQTYDRAAKAVTDRPDKSEGPTAGTSRPSTPLTFLVRVLVHVPDKGHVTARLPWLERQPPPWYAGQGRVHGHGGAGERHHDAGGSQRR